MNRLDQHSDETLIARANAGYADAFEALYERYRDWVASLAFRFTGDHELALDVMQDVFMYLLRKFPGFILTGHMKSFLWPVVRHTALAAKRKEARRAAQPLDEAAHSADAGPLRQSFAGDPSILPVLAAAMASLDEGHREAVILRYADDLSLQEIAVAMGLPLGTVKSRLHNALARLRERPGLKDLIEP